MQTTNTNGIGVTQFNGMKPRHTISIGGVDWSLRRDATDSSMVFPHQKVNWLNAGCEPLDGNIHYCWIMGVIAPTPGTIERPINVMYIGFHSQRILIAPHSVSQSDLDRMHVYVSDSSNFVGEFVGKFLGIEPEKPVAEREAISPWPNMPQQATQAEKVAENDEK
ncbi:hypothetical protein [Salmonella phage GSP032]|uniref:Uncharacterized protein n=3 Tax=Tlsvirus TaxID=1920865 RepID=A0A2R3U9B0_9CAUD|nr:hypothetical protein HOT01_gp25 [Salmonella phage vB_SenS_PHB07]AVQ09775.1 hypothetical protein [Salmonella phage vB_SenS_PHB07]UUT40992.1 hypothetical protein [Salmonella phage GSP032]